MASLSDQKKREKVQKLLGKIDSPEEVYNLFSEIGYKDHVKDQSYQRDVEDLGLKQKAADKIDNVYTILNYEDKLPVLLIETNSLSKTHTDYVTDRLTGKLRDVLLIFTEDYSELEFVFPDYESEGVPGEYDLKTTRLRVDTRNVFYSDADALSKAWLDEDKKWMHVWNLWEKAFSIDKVTEQFFEDYQQQFFQIREKVLEQVDDVHDAHEFTLQFMNRMMFVYFVDKKGWLEGEEGESYIQWLWDKYREQGGLQNEEDEFYDEWLTELFHKAFNNKFTSNPELPEEVSKSFSHAPYLNGGLFRENSLTKMDVELEDALVEGIIEDFFERYNFTIKEDSPVDKEVAVDPQMIGYVYESLSNVAEQLEDIDKDSRKEFGIFYTPKEEVYFMVRKSLSEYLNNNTEIPKEKIYRLIFAETGDQKDKAIEELSSGEFNQITISLRSMKAVDPACGSGAFLVGIIDEIAKVYRIAEGKDRREFDMFETKKKIIQESIYGVDVKDWAINASELRLFLQLLIETDIDKEKIQQDALLPNLRASLRVGDSLVQDIDGTFFDVSEENRSVEVNSWIERIQREKSYFFDSREKSEYGGIADIQIEEFQLAKQLITDKINTLEEQIGKGKTKQETLSGEVKEEGLSDKELEELEEKIGELEDLKSEVEGSPDKVPLIWEVAFAEVFKEKDGFDLVIGNPPYVEEKRIAPPNMSSDEVTKEDRDRYKEKLEKSVKERMPQVESIDGSSDLYIYFYFHGLSLLNENGAFCFITSNSWLDVNYGSQLQEFLCKYVPIKGIYSNKKKRAFEHADVNTAISIFGAPNFSKSFQDRRNSANWPETNHTAQFVTFKSRYREAIDPESVIELDQDENYNEEIELEKSSFQMYNTDNFRSSAITQKNLLLDGWNHPKNADEDSFSKGTYRGNKWGGKFIRSPDVVFSIRKEKSSSIGSLEEYAEVSRGITTNGNFFFHLYDVTEEIDDLKSREDNLDIIGNRDLEEAEDENLRLLFTDYSDWDKYVILPEEYLYPLIKSPKNLEELVLDEDSAQRTIFLCDKNHQSEHIKDYIEFADEKGISERSSFAGDENWYSLDVKDSPDLLWAKSVDDTHKTFVLDADLQVDQRLYEVANADQGLELVLNSTLFFLFKELYGRNNLGDGALDTTVYEAQQIPVVTPEKLSFEENPIDSGFNREIEPIFDEIGLRGISLFVSRSRVLCLIGRSWMILCLMLWGFPKVRGRRFTGVLPS